MLPWAIMASNDIDVENVEPFSRRFRECNEDMLARKKIK